MTRLNLAAKDPNVQEYLIGLSKNNLDLSKRSPDCSLWTIDALPKTTLQVTFLGVE